MTLSGFCRFVLILLSVVGTTRGAEYYVAVNGKPDAAGTKADPCDIISTLAGEKPVKPGDTVWMRGGKYRCERAYETAVGADGVPAAQRVIFGNRVVERSAG